jgi:cell division protein FtsZ
MSSIHLHLPDAPSLKPCITVFGVGGAGGNAVNNMIAAQLEGVNFVVANTDAQALDYSLAQHRIQLGEETTKGLGAGAAPDVGRAAAEESIAQIDKFLEGTNMVFITAGMGGGTGTGAAPVIARMARELGILTVGVVTKPFHFEGSHRMRLAEAGLQELQRYVDTLIVIPNQNLFRIANERTTFADAFKMADDVLHAGVRGVTDLMIMPGLINLDFADIRAVMSEMGKAMMGTGEADGDKRAINAAEAAISNPLLDNVSMKGARGVLINITGGPDMTLFEVDEAANRIRDEVDPDANIIFGSTFNPELAGRIRVSVVATGIEAAGSPHHHSSNTGGMTISTPRDRKAELISTTAMQALAAAAESASSGVGANAAVPPMSVSTTQMRPAVHTPIEEEPFFVAAKPIDPKSNTQKPSSQSAHVVSQPNSSIQPTQSQFSAAHAEDNTSSSSSSSAHSAPSSSGTVSRGFSLFGRIGSGASTRSQATTGRAPASAASSGELLLDERIEEQAEGLEVPAFMRRNKNPTNVN